MAPGSWGAGAVFSRFSGEDSGHTGEATGDPRVARCSRSFHLSNAPGLAGQLAASRKDSAREGGCPGGKTRLIFSCVTLSLKVLDLRETELGFARYGSANRGHRSVFGPPCTEANLGFARYDLVNRGRWNVPYVKGSFSDRDSGLTGGAIGDSGVACCS
uniref:Uncharacterized protein n=1 Tax=Fagus sylvatica TaxID=28930 RepID=A0A2N9GR70_FAGSY